MLMKLQKLMAGYERQDVKRDLESVEETLESLKSVKASHETCQRLEKTEIPHLEKEVDRLNKQKSRAIQELEEVRGHHSPKHSLILQVDSDGCCRENRKKTRC